MQETWTELQPADYLTKYKPDDHHQGGSVLIMTHCSPINDGMQTYAYWASKKSKAFPTHRSHTHLLSVQ